MGDRMKDYSFTITLQNSDDSAYTGSVPYTKTLKDGSTQTETLTLVSGSASFSLKHTESINLQDLPGSLQYTIAEAEQDAYGYETSYTVNGTTAANGRTLTGSLSENLDIVCQNTRQVILTTGVSAPDHTFLLLLTSSLFAVLLLRQKRKRTDGALE